MCQAADIILTNAADMGSIPPPGRSHMSGSNTSLCATTTEPGSRAHQPQLLNPTPNKEEPPLTARRESPRKSEKDPPQPK